MRAVINIKFNDRLTLPIQYNYIVQAVILRWLGDENYAKFIHDAGYEYNKRKYKMYTFSRLEGKFTINSENKTIIFYDEVHLTISCEDEKFLTYLINNVITKDEFYIINQQVYVDEVSCKNKKLSAPVEVFTKSPIVIYSTLENAEKKKTYYYSPYEKEFGELIKKNLINKYNALYRENPEDDNFEIQPLKNRRLKENILVYKGTVIKGWSGEFILKGSNELINIAYNTGLGSKNSQGFGCIEVVAKRNVK